MPHLSWGAAGFAGGRPPGGSERGLGAGEDEPRLPFGVAFSPVSYVFAVGGKTSVDFLCTDIGFPLLGGLDWWFGGGFPFAHRNQGGQIPKTPIQTTNQVTKGYQSYGVAQLFRAEFRRNSGCSEYHLHLFLLLFGGWVVGTCVFFCCTIELTKTQSVTLDLLQL